MCVYMYILVYMYMYTYMYICMCAVEFLSIEISTVHSCIPDFVEYVLINILRRLCVLDQYRVHLENVTEACFMKFSIHNITPDLDNKVYPPMLRLQTLLSWEGFHSPARIRDPGTLPRYFISIYYPGGKPHCLITGDGLLPTSEVNCEVHTPVEVLSKSMF